MNNRYTTFFGLLKKMPEITKEEAVNDFTAGRTKSLKELSDAEVRELIKAMQLRLGQQPSQNPKHQQANDERRPMRGKIIHYLCLMGYTQPDGKADFEKINQLVINIGSNNPRRVILNYLYKDELLAVLNQVEEMYRKELKKKR